MIITNCSVYQVLLVSTELFDASSPVSEPELENRESRLSTRTLVFGIGFIAIETDICFQLFEVQFPYLELFSVIF